MARKIYPLVALALGLTLLLAACGGGGGEKPTATKAPAQPTAPAQSAGDAARGKELYAACAGCHGPNGEGIEGLGKPWQNSEFIKSLTDDELLAFIKKGRPISDPDNTTGVDMPPKGGNPSLTDDDLRDIIAFMRTLE